MRLLCLHGFGNSAKIMKTQMMINGEWPECVLDKLDLVYIDAPFPCLQQQGTSSNVQGMFDPPYYEWFQFNKMDQDFSKYQNFDECLAFIEDFMIKNGPFDGLLGFSQEFTEYQNLDECLAFIEDFMIKHGPFDGLLGFSQGAALAAALPGLQANGVALTKVPKIKFVIIIGGAIFRNPSLAKMAYSPKIQCPSLHFLGEQDFLQQYGIELMKFFVDPLVITHPKGHTIPRFDEKGLKSMLSFLERMQKEIKGKDKHENAKLKAHL